MDVQSLNILTSKDLETAICEVRGDAVFSFIACSDVGKGDNKRGYNRGGAGHTALMELFSGDVIEHFGIECKFPSERTVELVVVRTVVRTGDLLDVPSSIFMREDESML